MKTTTENRPWGSYTVLDEGATYKVKQITVLPDKRLSYQYHHHRQEHWYIVAGIATVTLEGTDHILQPGQSIDIPLGAKHRMANTGREPVTLVEIQRGTYFGEDDIVRLEDDFGRS